jgi:hypothetical protein
VFASLKATPRPENTMDLLMLLMLLDLAPGPDAEGRSLPVPPRAENDDVEGEAVFSRTGAEDVPWLAPLEC